MSLKFQKLFSASEIKAAWHLIETSRNFVLLGHQDPDRDTVFACLAMAELLSSLNKPNITVIFPNKPCFRLPKTSAKVLFGRHKIQPDLILTFDAPVRQRLYFPPEFANTPVINVDHHLDNQIGGQCNFVDINACSACEVLARLILDWDPKLLTATLSQLLLVGILDDSFVFKTQQSGYSALFTTLKLIDAGANFNKAKALVANYKTPGVAKLWANLMAQGQVLAQERLFLMVLNAAQCAQKDFSVAALEGVVNFVASIVNCDIVVLLRELVPGKIKCSLRSKQTDVKSIAAQFGGGGHKYASGFSIDNADLTKISQRLVSSVQKT